MNPLTDIQGCVGVSLTRLRTHARTWAHAHQGLQGWSVMLWRFRRAGGPEGFVAFLSGMSLPSSPPCFAFS